MDAKKCGAFIQSIRKEKRLTQNELADLIGVTDKAISRWETGEGFPEVTLLPKLSEVLGVSVDELLKGERIGIVKQSSPKNHVSRFKLYSNLNVIGMFFGLILSILVINLNSDKADAIWYGLIPLLIFNFAGLIVYIVLRTFFIEKSVFIDEEKRVLYNQTKWTYFAQILTVFLYAPYIVGHYFYLTQNGWMIGIIRFDWYLLWALFSGLIAGLIIMIVNTIHRKMIHYPTIFDKIKITIDTTFVGSMIAIANLLLFLIIGQASRMIEFLVVLNLVAILTISIIMMIRKSISFKWLPLVLLSVVYVFLEMNVNYYGVHDIGALLFLLIGPVVFTILGLLAFLKKKVVLLTVVIYLLFVSLASIIPFGMDFLFNIYMIVVLGIFILVNWKFKNS